MNAATIYNNIQRFSSTLRDNLEGGLPFGLKNFPLFVRMETKNLQRLINVTKTAGYDIPTPPEDEPDGHLLACFGIDDDGKFTVSFLALDSKGNVDERHYMRGDDSIKGEETWLPKNVTGYIYDAEGAHDFLPEPAKPKQ